MSRSIQIRNDLLKTLQVMKEAKGEKTSYSDVLDDLLNKDVLNEALVSQEGRISKTLAGKTILYKVKD